MKFVASVLFCFVATQAFAQGIQGYNNYVNPQTTAVQVVAPQVVAPQPQYPQPIPQEWMANGYREEFKHSDVHEVRPIRDWEYPNYPVTYPQQQVVYPQHQYQYQAPCQYQYQTPYQYQYQYQTPCCQQYRPCCQQQQWYYPPCYQYR